MNMKEKLESLGKNSIMLKIAKKEKYKLSATRFGGKPDVPLDFVWPTYEGESYDHVVKDRPLTFLAQFNCCLLYTSWNDLPREVQGQLMNEDETL